MTVSAAIASILAALLLGAMSPGPSFVLVARNAIGLSRSNGIATALGMGVGGIFFSGIALCGFYTLLAAVAVAVCYVEDRRRNVPDFSCIQDMARRRPADCRR